MVNVMMLFLFEMIQKGEEFLVAHGCCCCCVVVIVVVGG